MRVTVTDQVLEYFWEPPHLNHEEFWGFQYPPKACIGEEILFFNNNRLLIASAIISRIDAPGVSTCGKSCRFKNRWKVYWSPGTFLDLRKKE